MKREWYEAKADKLVADARRSVDPERAALRIVEHLERQADQAERRQASMEDYLARAVDAMQRADTGRRAAARAQDAAARVEADRRREAKRRRKNARARERYRQRRMTEAARVNTRTGMHALAIEVDPAAYRAVKVEALRSRGAIPTLIGDILRDRPRRAGNVAPSNVQTRWRRTGQGRRANQHTRIDVDDDTWNAIHLEAIQGGQTVSRRIGLLLEEWCASRLLPTTPQKRNQLGLDVDS